METQLVDPKKIKWDDLEKLELSKKGTLVLRNYLLNQTPPAVFVKSYTKTGEEAIGNDKVAYQDLPIDKVEYLLTCFFLSWRVEIKSVFQLANSVCAIIRLYYLNPETGEYDWQDGGGASPLQLNSGSETSDYRALKTGAVKMAVPTSISEAEKDAADKIGKLFGRDLNRKNTLNYDVLVKNDELFKDAKIIEK